MILKSELEKLVMITKLLGLSPKKKEGLKQKELDSK